MRPGPESPGCGGRAERGNRRRWSSGRGLAAPRARRSSLASVRTRPRAPDRARGRSCRSRSTRRHTATYHGELRTVHYRFHPRAGAQVEVVRRRRPAHLVVRQPDGTLSCLPEWMTRPEASAFDVRDVPVLPRRALAALRAVVDACFSSETEPMEGERGDAMAAKVEAGGVVRTGHPRPTTNGGAAGGARQASRRSDLGSDREPGRGKDRRRA